MRQWISIRGPGGLRFGQSIGPEDLGPPKLPGRRYELRKQLQTAAMAEGKTMTVADRGGPDGVTDPPLLTGCPLELAAKAGRP